VSSTQGQISTVNGGGRAARYRAPGADVASQEFGDETIIIRLNVGVYYSLNPAAAAVWRLACAGHTLDETLEACSGGGVALDEDIAAIWESFVQAELVRPAQPGADPPAAAPAAALDCRPGMTQYTDMQDLFALDPVHDVDESGWPSTQPQSPAPGV
jgi:hypothetical protein